MGQAEKNGCVAFVVERILDADVPQVKVENVRSAMAYIAAAFYGHPEKEIRMVGVCGTKGKTTTSYLMKAILEKAGFKTGLIGTTGNMIGEKRLHSNLTTPDPIDLHRCLRQMRDEGVEAVSMEVSAHAVAMHRLDGVTFEACLLYQPVSGSSGLFRHHGELLRNQEELLHARTGAQRRAERRR